MGQESGLNSLGVQAQGLSPGGKEGVGQDCSHLKGPLGKDPLPSSLTWPQAWLVAAYIVPGQSETLLSTWSLASSRGEGQRGE